MEKEFKTLKEEREECLLSRTKVDYYFYREKWIKDCIKRIKEEYKFGTSKQEFFKKIDKHTGFEEGEK